MRHNQGWTASRTNFWGEPYRYSVWSPWRVWGCEIRHVYTIFDVEFESDVIFTIRLFPRDFGLNHSVLQDFKQILSFLQETASISTQT